MVPTRSKKTTRKTPKPMVKKEKKQSKEMTKLGAALRAIGAAGGATLGGYIGYPVHGGSIGHSLGAALSKWLGSGDYQINKNSILSTQDIPVMHSSNQSVIIRHKEFVTQLTGSTAFTVKSSVVLNPGLAESFPWLATIAGSYSEYRIRGMVFHYVPTSGAAVSGTNPALGSVMFQTTYRSSDTAPVTKTEMLNEYCANEAMPADTLCHPIECDPKENPFKVQYVRGSSVPSGDSKLLYDLGTTHIATSGMPADNNVVGDVWVTYEVELKKPVVSSNVTTLDSYYGAFTPTSSTVFSSGITNSSPNVIAVLNSLNFPAVIGRWYTVMIVLRLNSQTSESAFNYASISGATLGDGPIGPSGATTIRTNGSVMNGSTVSITCKATSNSILVGYTPPNASGYLASFYSIVGYT